MQDERFIIMKMLEEGKITAVEAMALLEALEENVKSESHEEVEPRSFVSIEKTEESADHASDHVRADDADRVETDREPGSDQQKERSSGSQDGGDQTDETSKDFNWSNIFPKDLGDQIRESVQTAIKNMPQLTEEWRENWKEVKRDIKRSLSEVKDEVNKGVSIDIGGIKRVLYRGRPQHEYIERIDGSWEGATGPINVQLLSQNGSIAVRGWDEPHYQVTLRKHVHGITDEDEASTLAKEAVKVDQRENGLEVIVLPKDRVSVSIEAYLPKDKTYDLSALTKNGGLVVEDIKSKETKAVTTNGGASVKSIIAERFEVRTTNGGIVCESIDAAEARATTTNGGIRWQGKAGRTDLETTNGGITAEPATPPGACYFRAHTTNASVNIVLPRDESLGLRVRASGMPVEMRELESIKSHVEQGDSGFARRVTGETPDFDAAVRSLSLDVKTTNGRVAIRHP